MKNSFYILFLVSSIFALEIPINTSEKIIISNWLTAKVEDFNDTLIEEFNQDPKKYFTTIKEEKIRNINLSSYNDVTIALYQLYKNINFKTTFLITSIIEVKTDQVCAFYFDDYEMDVLLYINGKIIMSELSGDKRFFETKLNKGKNIITMIGTPHGRYRSAFKLEIFDQSLGRIKLKVKNSQGIPISNVEIGIRDSKTSNYFNQDENGENTYWVSSGSYQIAGFEDDRYQWSKKIKIDGGEKKDVNLILNNNQQISGTILTKDNKTPHPGVQIDLVDMDNNEIFSSKTSNLSGKYFFKPPVGKWYVRIYANNKHQFHETNGKKTVIDIKNTSNKKHELNFTIPNQIKGSWGKISMFDGMLSDGAHVSIVSSDDLLYLGTYNGLSVYDGLKVNSYNYDQGLPNGFIAEIYEDSDNFIWIGYGLKGLVKWKNGQVINYYTTKDGLPSDNINAIAEDKDGNLLIGTSDGLSIFNGETFSNYNFTHGLGNGFITDIKVVGNNIWVGCGIRSKTGGNQAIGGGLSIFNGKTFKSFDLTNFQNLDPFVSSIRVIETDNSGNLWIGTHGGLLKYDGSKFHIFRSHENGLPSNDISDLLIDNNGIWICTQKGLVNMVDNGLKVVIPLEKEGLSYEYLQSISKSGDGIYFIGSDNGVFLYDPNSFRTNSSYEGLPVPNNWTRGILDLALDKEGYLWATSGWNGIYKLDDGIIIENFTKENSELTMNYSQQLEFANDGSIWFVHGIGGVTRYSDNKIKNMTKKLKIPSNTSVEDIAFDKEGIIWLATSRGLGMYKNDSLIIYDMSDGLIRPESNCDVNVGKNNEIIYSTYGSGFSIYYKNKFTNFDESNGLADNRIWDLAIDSKNNYWLALDGSAVQMFDGKNFVHHQISDGVTAGETFTAYVDDFDNIWIGTFGGGVCYYDGNIWNSVDTRDGLLDNLVGSIYAVDGNKYWFGSERGITEYVPKRQTPTVFIDQIETSQGTFKSLNELKNNKYKLLKGSRITFTLNSNSFNTKKEKQKYIINIIKNGTKESLLIKNNEFEFFPSSSGNYQLEFQSIDRDMNYSKTKKIDLSIIGPWYLNPLTAIPFWGFIILLISFSTYTTNKYINQRRYTLSLKEESQKKDRKARKDLEEKNSQLLESQKAAETANEAKSTFLANMSHELRTPLNAIIGYSEMLIEDAEDENEDFIPDLDKINSSGKHLLGLINDILDLSKVESGKMELFIEEFNLEKVIGEIESTIKPLVDKNKNTLKVQFNTDLKTMTADITKIRQILLNLLSNSSKFTKEGTIKINITNSKNLKDAIDFSVSDSGIGMTPDQVNKIFKPFTQADEKTTRKFGGTGLGLTITKMFAEMMGGDIRVKSIEGKGTTFIVTIPIKVIDQKKVLNKINKKLPEKNNYTILVIDDDRNAQEMMKRFLIKQNYSVIQANSGKEGLKLAEKHSPDAITLDVMMPEMDGWAVLTELQKNTKTKDIPVIMITMANKPDIGYSLGATDYLTKPVNWEKLTKILDNHKIVTNSQTILVVEDDDVTRDMLKKSLENNNYKVRVAINGKEGLENVKQIKPGLIILDLMMPEMDGFEFAERLREKKEWMDIPVVVITAKDLTKKDHKRLKGNVEAIMQKGSYSKNDLMSEIGNRIKKLQLRS